MSKSLFLFLGFFTLAGFGFAGLMLIYYLQERPPFEIFGEGWPWPYQLLLGVTYGVVTGFIGWSIVRSKLLNPVRATYTDIIQSLGLNWWEIVYISFCAGVGEELLFRAGLQPWAAGWAWSNLHIGIWLTAIVFVAIHGYLSPTNWRLSIYGVFMTVVIGGMGYMYEHIGIIGAIAAHFAIDVVLLGAINNYQDPTRILLDKILDQEDSEEDP